LDELKSQTLHQSGAVLAYDIRRNASSIQPALLLIGSPMSAVGFGTLASHFTDRTVVTYDPRGSDRSIRTDGAHETTPEEHAEDLHRLIETLDAGPIDIFASSGGAVNALVLVAKHPEQVRTLVAHEPPTATVLPDCEPLLAACRDIRETYYRNGFGLAMAKFIALVSFEGQIPANWTEREAPDPAIFGLPTMDDSSRDDPLLGQNIPSCNAYKFDFLALRAGSTRIVIGVGEETGKVMTGRAATAVAEQLGTKAVTFPGGHQGFLGGEFGQTGKPGEFAAKLRNVLSGKSETSHSGY
jgi:pimeloyl-ACP methyl ester carboxylesterase